MPEESTTEHEILFVPEIAKIMRMGPVTVYSYIRSGDLKAERYGTGNKSIRVSRKDFEEWRERHRVQAEDPATARS